MIMRYVVPRKIVLWLVVHVISGKKEKDIAVPAFVFAVHAPKKNVIIAQHVHVIPTLERSVPNMNHYKNALDHIEPMLPADLAECAIVDELDNAVELEKILEEFAAALLKSVRCTITEKVDVIDAGICPYHIGLGGEWGDESSFILSDSVILGCAGRSCKECWKGVVKNESK